MYEFGLDEANVIQQSTFEQFKQNSKEKHRVSIVAFKRYSDNELIKALKAKIESEGDEAELTDMEKQEIIVETDKKLAAKLGKPVESLSEIDRLDIASPKFGFSMTHYFEENEIGTIKCFSEFNKKNEIVKAEICCKKSLPGQTIGTVIMTYPLLSQDEGDLEADIDLLNMKKMVSFHPYKLNTKKFGKIKAEYLSAKKNDKNRVALDFKVELDGDPKYQKQIIQSGTGVAVWTTSAIKPEVRQWILETGLRAWKSVDSILGFKMDKQKFIAKLNGGSSEKSSYGGSDKKMNTNYGALSELRSTNN